MVKVMNTARVIQSRSDSEAIRKEQESTSGFAARLEPIVAHEVATRRWQDFCQWCSQSMQGIVTDIERDTGKELRVVECLQQPLQQIAARVSANGVIAIDVTVAVNGKPRVFEVAGPRWLRVHCNSAGLPIVLEIGDEEGKLILHFTGATAAAPVFSGNSWGE